MKDDFKIEYKLTRTGLSFVNNERHRARELTDSIGTSYNLAIKICPRFAEAYFIN